MNFDIQPKIETVSKNESFEQNEKIKKAIEWTEKNIKKIENKELLENYYIEIFSDQELNGDDLEFISKIKQNLDESGVRPIKVIILKSENWKEFMRIIGRDDEHMEFTGRAEERPIVPIGMHQFIVLPSSEVFQRETKYKQLYSQSEKAQMQIQNAPVEFYRNIYLRNILSHEMAHLYQFSPDEVTEILNSKNEEGQKKFNQNLDLRESLSCIFGLLNLKRSDNSSYNAFIEACQNLIKQSIEDLHVTEQAQRSLDAVKILEDYSEEEIRQIFTKIHKLMQDDNDAQKQKLKEDVLQIRNGKKKFRDLLSQEESLLQGIHP